jgi:hypothetical protein
LAPLPNSNAIAVANSIPINLTTTPIGSSQTNDGVYFLITGTNSNTIFNATITYCYEYQPASSIDTFVDQVRAPVAPRTIDLLSQVWSEKPALSICNNEVADTIIEQLNCAFGEAEFVKFEEASRILKGIARRIPDHSTLQMELPAAQANIFEDL